MSGSGGCRGATFKDDDHCTKKESDMHVTDFFLSSAESSSGETLVQTASRTTQSEALSQGDRRPLVLISGGTLAPTSSLVYIGTTTLLYLGTAPCHVGYDDVMMVVMALI